VHAIAALVAPPHEQKPGRDQPTHRLKGLCGTALARAQKLKYGPFAAR